MYRLFHEFGVRYLRPGRKNEFFQVLSENDWAEKEISIEETASFRHRGSLALKEQILMRI